MPTWIICSTGGGIFIDCISNEWAMLLILLCGKVNIIFPVKNTLRLNRVFFADFGKRMEQMDIKGCRHRRGS